MTALVRAAGALAIALLAGCSFHAPTPVARVHHGPAHRRVVDPIAALPVLCASQGASDACVPEHRRAVATVTRMALEFEGYALVDSELLNAESLRRSAEPDAGDPANLERKGRGFIALSPDEQRALLGSIGVHGVLRASILFGPAHGAAQQRTVTVEVTLTSLLDDALAWRSRCSVETGDFNSTERAIDLAARCALESGSHW